MIYDISFFRLKCGNVNINRNCIEIAIQLMIQPILSQTLLFFIKQNSKY